MEVDIDWLKQLVKVASEKEDGGLIQSKIIFSQERYRINSVGNPLHYLGFSWSGGYKELSSRFQRVEKITVASGASVLIKAEVLRVVGFLDDRFFMYHEDLDLSWRAELAGFNIYLSPDSKAYHKYSFSFGTKKFYYFERNRWLVFFSNYRLGTILLLLPAFILTDLAMLIYALFTGWFRFKVSSYFGFFLLIPHLLKRRIDNGKIRQRTDREIFNLMVSELDFDDVNNFLIKRLYNPFAKVYFKVIKSLITW
jgi:GT2 family glycosyltransferase